ncbi:MAG: HAD family hydrolase [Paracoccaceae bacterium]
MQLQAIIFDLDGTLAETADLHREAWNTAFAQCGLPWRWGRALFSTLLHIPDGMARLRAYEQSLNPGKPLEMCTYERLRALSAAKTAAYASALRAGAATPRKGTIRLLNEARAEGLPIAAVSTGSRIDFELLVFHAFGFDALGWFDCVRCHNESRNAPHPYSAVIKAMGLTPPRCLAIDDSDEGANAACAAGLQVLATPGLYTSSHRFESAALVLSDLGCPEAPFDVIRGNACGHSFVTPSALRDWGHASRTAA